MINLDPAVGSSVIIQFKHPVYLIGAQGGRLVPLNMSDDNNRPGPPLVVDHMEGNLRKEQDSFILTFLSPVDRTTQIDFVVDPENVAGLWYARKIQLVTAVPGLPTSP